MAIRRLNHLEYPAFEKMNHHGRMIKSVNTTIKKKHRISPIPPINIGISAIISSSMRTSLEGIALVT
jgi:hypothetical protein